MEEVTLTQTTLVGDTTKTLMPDSPDTGSTRVACLQRTAGTPEGEESENDCDVWDSEDEGFDDSPFQLEGMNSRAKISKAVVGQLHKPASSTQNPLSGTSQQTTSASTSGGVRGPVKGAGYTTGGSNTTGGGKKRGY